MGPAIALMEPVEKGPQVSPGLWHRCALGLHHYIRYITVKASQRWFWYFQEMHVQCQATCGQCGARHWSTYILDRLLLLPRRWQGCFKSAAHRIAPSTNPPGEHTPPINQADTDRPGWYQQCTHVPLKVMPTIRRC